MELFDLRTECTICINHFGNHEIQWHKSKAAHHETDWFLLHPGLRSWRSSQAWGDVSLRGRMSFYGTSAYFLGDPSHKPWKSTVMVRWFKVFVSLQFLNARLNVELVSLSFCLSFKRWISEFVQLSSEFLPWSSMPLKTLWGTNQSLLLILENPFSQLNCDHRCRNE